MGIVAAIFACVSTSRGATADVPAEVVGLKEKSRRVLVIHGWDEREAEKPASLPVDTMTGELFQMSLEWLGYEADYLNIGHANLPRPEDARFAAVIFDAELDIPLAKELDTVSWIRSITGAGVPVLFAGQMPFDSEDAKAGIARALGLRGTLQPVRRLTRSEIVTKDDSLMKSEMPVAPRQTMFHDLQAPEISRVCLGLSGVSADGASVRYDPVFLASWGGVWLEPFVIFRGSPDNSPFYADPFAFFGAFLERHGPVPAPDTTTRDGRRIFYSHIDGDGFASRSDFKGHPFCAELVRDRILKVFPLPVTVSVIEAEIRALAQGYDEAAAGDVRELARSILALPNVQVGSHSFAHPYQWDAADPNPGLYTEAFMTMKPAAGYTKVDVEREIRGSINYINDELAPQDKPVEIMLWSGNCRPGEAALRLCREMGVENMNGGNTIISRLYPGLAGIAPRVMPWGGELQIHAANQNEFMYANGWNGPFYGGFADVIDTFERTEQGRRLKPVNVYYHFYSATNLSSMRALEKIHRWCSEQPLHAITARQFARITRDARATRVFEAGARRWKIVNAGECRTFRLPAALGEPDLAQCKGVTGHALHGESIYVHTSGLPVTELVLADAGKTDSRLRLAASSAEIRFGTLDAAGAEFEVNDVRPVEVEFAGLPPNASCRITINDRRSTAAADVAGLLKLSLPPVASVKLDASSSRYDSLR